MRVTIDDIKFCVQKSSDPKFAEVVAEIGESKAVLKCTPKEFFDKLHSVKIAFEIAGFQLRSELM